jgi:hypothetical protein
MAQIDAYTKNMAALQRFFPGLEQKLSGTAAEGLLIETAANGEPTARLDGRYLHSAREVKSIVTEQYPQAEKVVLGKR